MKILVTGGAGYIGSHVVKQLSDEKKHEIMIVDNLSTGFSETIGKLIVYDNAISFKNLDLSDWVKTEELIKNEQFDAVIHFAASLIVPESVLLPHQYYLNNTANTANLIYQCAKYGVNKFIFSSTAAVYGNFQDGIVSEDTLLSPINPYGYSKAFSEQVLKDTTVAYPEFRYVILRYFNVAGANVDGIIGQSTQNATHLIKVAAQTALGQRKSISIFGEDYPTPDGTCIRDYIHIDDLSYAHIFALHYLQDHPSEIFNVGYGKGYSVKEVLETMQQVSHVPFPILPSAKREGDPAILIANNQKILNAYEQMKPTFKRELFKYNKLDFICECALEWEKKLCMI